jgi:S-methylmethionine-dependent homocysteine/selenocysteine methylase
VSSVQAILFNCCEPEAITLALERIQSDNNLSSVLKESKVLLGAYANRLTKIDPAWSLQESEAPQPFRKDLDEAQYWEDFVSKWTKKLNVQLVGGCCGIQPSHIAYLKKMMDQPH